MSKSDVSMGYKINNLPEGTTKQQFFDTLYRQAVLGLPLPAGWDVDWIWRNTKKQPIRSDSLQSAVKKSRAGFIALMLKRIKRDAARAGVSVTFAVREATEDEEDIIEEDEDETFEGRRERNVGQGTREKRQFEKRSRAAKKGWRTRRRREREKRK